MAASAVTADGRAVWVRDRVARLPTAAKRVEIHWTRRAGTRELSFARAVREYLAEYRRRYQRFLETGQ